MTSQPRVMALSLLKTPFWLPSLMLRAAVGVRL